MIYTGDCLTVLRTLPDASVQMCVTSPPYFGLRDYGIPPTVWGGDPSHPHDFATETVKTEVGRGNWAQGVNGRGEQQPGGVEAKREPIRATAKRGFCECGAWLGTFGLEPTPALFVEHAVSIFEEVRRVLKPDGVLWLNLGDSYSGSGPSGASYQSATTKARTGQKRDGAFAISDTLSARGLTYAEKKPIPAPGLKAKDLIGIPWRVAFALQEAGWYLRCDVIWSKPNPMPESVTDRPTKAHEYIFLLSKSERYFYDSEAIKEPGVYAGLANPYSPPGQTPHSGARSSGGPKHDKQPGHGRRHAGFNDRWDAMERAEQTGVMRNKRSVWNIATRPFPEAHFATFPEEIPMLCILAGSRPGDVVLDPFNGAGTTGVVCEKLGRSYIGIELNPAYVEMATRRIANVAPLFSQETA